MSIGEVSGMDVNQPKTNYLTAGFMRMAARVEHIAARVQGKGYLSPSVRDEVRFVLDFLRQAPKLAVDIGSNIGKYTAELRRTTPRIEIHAFEPSAVNIKKLVERFKDDGLTNIVPLAVSDNCGVTTLYSDTAGSVLASLAKRRLEHFNTTFDVTEAVKVIRFDEYWVDRLDKRVLDIVKIDIEGHELSALRGFGDAIEATRVLQFEFGGTNIDTRTYWQDFWYFFREHDFDLYRITPLGVLHLDEYRESDEYFSFVANFIAANRRFAA